MATSTAPPVPVEGGRKRPRKGKLVRLSRGDRITVFVMAAVPTLLVLWLVWLPGVASVVLGFFRWEGIGSFDTASWVGTENYKNIFTNYPPFRPAIEHNLIWLAVLFLVPTPLGIFLAVLLDKEIRGSRFYQTSLFIPVVLSLALVGFMWQLIYSPEQGLLNQITGGTTDWYGDPNINLWAVLVAVCWKHDRLRDAALPGRAEGASTRRCARPRRSTARRRRRRSSRSSSR